MRRWAAVTAALLACASAVAAPPGAGGGAIPAPAGAGGSAGPGPARVMSINLCTDQIVLALLPPERITSVTWLSHDPDASLMAEAARRLPANRGMVEEVLRDAPDLVIAGSFTTPATRALLRKLGRPVIEVAHAESFDDIRRITRQIASAVQAEARGEALIAEMDAVLASLAATRAQPPLRVAAWDGAGFSARRGSLLDHLLRAAGAGNVLEGTAGHSASGSDVESLLVAAPQALVRGTRNMAEAGRRADVAFHPLVRRYWAERTVFVPQAAHVCGTPMAARAALQLQRSLAALGNGGATTPELPRW